MTAVIVSRAASEEGTGKSGCNLGAQAKGCDVNEEWVWAGQAVLAWFLL